MDKKEYLFNEMQPKEDGVELTISGIEEAMEKYAKDRCIDFLMWKIGKGASRYEVELIHDQFINSIPF